MKKFIVGIAILLTALVLLVLNRHLIIFELLSFVDIPLDPAVICGRSCSFRRRRGTLG